MLIPLSESEISKLIPLVATAGQFKYALGNPSKIFQRLMISSIGGVITLLVSQSQITSKFYSLWLVIGVGFILYLLWGPILEASKINAKIKKFNYKAIFSGEIISIEFQEKIVSSKEQANQKGELELIQSKKLWTFIEISDEDGYLGTTSAPFDEKHKNIREGMRVAGVVFSNFGDFQKISAISDLWIPRQKYWIGKYPYLLRPAFEELFSIRFRF